MCVPLALSEEFDASYWIQSKDATWFQAFMVRMAAPLALPQIISSMLFTKQDVNIFTEKKIKEGLSGKINVTTSPAVQIDKLKACGKAKGVTINDVVLAAFTTTLTDIMKENELKKPEDQRREIP